MSYIKIYYERWSSPSVKNSRTVPFDTVTGTGPDPNYPFDFRLKFNGEIIWNKTKALQILSQPNWNGKTFYQAFPILPTVPPETLMTTIWKNFPENQPEERETPYRCHIRTLDGKIALTSLPYAIKDYWGLIGVYEFTDSLTDNTTPYPNPAYPAAKAEYDAKYAEYINFFGSNFVMIQKYLSPIIPTETDNQNLIPSLLTLLGLTDPVLIPDKYFWHWWFVNADGSKTPTTVTKGQYTISPVVLDDYSQHPYYLKIINYIAPLKDNTTRIKYIIKT